jgi:4-alpha-glucanotransferase
VPERRDHSIGLLARHRHGQPNQACVDGNRSWLIAVRLSGVRSQGNWGHGDFTHAATPLHYAAHYDTGGTILNPLHMLLDDRPDHISPYSPNSRRLLNPLYIDMERVSKFPGIAALRLEAEVAPIKSSLAQAES